MLELVASERVTWTMGSTPFVIDAIAAQNALPRDTSTLKFFACAGAPIPPHLAPAARKALGSTLVAIWGMTENGVVTITRPEDPPDFAGQSDGRVVPWMELKVVDDEDREVAPGVVGRLLVRGASQCVGYFKRLDLYVDSLLPGDWFDTGDLARVDSSGAIRIAGRVKDLIIRGGENIPVVEVEAAIYQMSSVREVAVVGVADERLGERACAVIVPNGDAPTLNALQVHMQSLGFAKQFWPELLKVVAELPKTPSGKVQKFKLRDSIGLAGVRFSSPSR
jgi:cyclohexanecarboxylate-CoA ligase